MNADGVDVGRLKRTAVIGTSCAGKTTFAQRLARATGVKHIELDALNWMPNWTPRPHEEFRMMVEQAVAGDAWVSDGNYTKLRDIIWSRATTLVWLDYSFPVVVRRAVSRTLRRLLYRQTLYAGNRESFRRTFLDKDSILLWVVKTYHRRRRDYRRLLPGLANERLQILVFHSPEQARRFLSKLEKQG